MVNVFSKLKFVSVFFSHKFVDNYFSQKRKLIYAKKAELNCTIVNNCCAFSFSFWRSIE